MGLVTYTPATSYSWGPFGVSNVIWSPTETLWPLAQSSLTMTVPSLKSSGLP